MTVQAIRGVVEAAIQRARVSVAPIDIAFLQWWLARAAVAET